MNTIGERLKNAREKKKMKQSDVATLLGKNQTTIAAMENNRSTNAFQTLAELCKILDVSADWILYGTEERGAPPVKEELNEEGQKLLEQYKAFLIENYPRKKYKEVGNL
ncbi:MAG: helix-turn-helix transcriptional regulator [Clostridia bacterium]|nr:helix-turn-helix transcriptional regulator [Clostridia bacterium]